MSYAVHLKQKRESPRGAHTTHYEINYKNLSVKLSDGSSVRGKVNLSGDYRRLSDFMKHAPDKFVTLVSEGASEQQSKVIIINKDYVVWAEPED